MQAKGFQSQEGSKICTGFGADDRSQRAGMQAERD
jgi:hypothetical protein